MELSKKHREVLLIKLEELNEALEAEKNGLKLAVEASNKHIIPIHQLYIFLIRESIETIKTALIENRIDF